MSEWKEYRLGDFLKVKHGYAFKGENIVTEETPNILVTPGNFNIGGGFKSDKFKYYKGDEFPKEYILTSGDIVVTMTDLSKDSDTLGYSAKIPYSTTHNYLHNQRIGLVQFVNENVCRDFVYWLMRTREYQNYIVGSASGTSIMHTSPSRIEDYRCLIPSSLSEQESIASILTSIDNKINLLHRENETLEALGETLFCQWFIEEANGDDISLGEVVKTTSGGTPSRKKEEYYCNGNVKWVKSKELHHSYILETEEKITEDAVAYSSAKLLPENSVLIAMYGATVGEYGILAEPMTCNQAVCALIPNENYPYTYLYLWAKYMQGEFINLACGAAQQNISQELIKQQYVSNDLKQISDFHILVAPYMEKMKVNQEMIKTLNQMRDGLLPKLMNREVLVYG